MEETDPDELRATLEELTRQNKYLQLENELFQSYAARCEDKLLADGIDDASVKEEKDSKASRLRRGRVQATLKIEQKNNICIAELEEAKKQSGDMKINSERLIDTLRAVLEETDVRLAELRKDAYEFKRDVVVGAENFRTGKTIAEKMVRYLEEKLRQKDTAIEKLQLKNVVLQNQARTIESQLRHKEEMGDVLHYIDFHQLQIENKQYIAKVGERNEELLKLKQASGKTVQLLNQLRKKLQELMEESDTIRVEIQSRKVLSEKVTEEIMQNTEQCEKGSKQALRYQSQQNGDNQEDSPQIMDHILQKAKIYEFRTEIKSLERKIEIAERAVKVQRAQMQKVVKLG
uniref:Cilia- and flagella-associated protein 263 n=1 Tax=Albugo laibachii Nc14 TaxID=890382 RepID=F0WQ09_9STRA|nr:conserved hypothetical protein [Albugo laibachii Nc14]|eukprot:CCA23414.1 conserved hypothetical protein [Albugo laibachii Nc14]